MIKTKKELLKYIAEDKKTYQPSGGWISSFLWCFSKSFTRLCFLTLKYNRLYIFYKNKKIKSLFYKYLYFKYSRSIGLEILGVDFGKAPLFLHQNIIIAPDTIIGNSCIFHGFNVIGKKNKQEECPLVGDNVEFCVGSIVLGKICIGSNSRIGACTFVNKNVLENETVVGIPAKPITR